MSYEPARSVVSRALPAVSAAACALAFGFAAGWLAGARSSPRGEADAHPPFAGAPGKLSPRTLANIGVEVGEAGLGEFVRTREVLAVVELPDAARAPAHAPVSGVVRRVLAVEGQRVAAKAPVAELLRDPFPRPELALVDAVLRPLNEEYHAAIAELRTAAQSHAIAVEELARVLAVMGEGAEGAVPAKVERDLAYEEIRTSRALEAAREELERHGLTREEIARAEKGADVPLGVDAIRRVLERNLLWSPAAQAAFDALPEPLRALPFTVAVLGELAGTRLVTHETAAALRELPALAAAFLDVAGLLQQGWPMERLRELEALGALAPVVPVRAPDGAEDWDVARVFVKPGARVESGAVVAQCVDPRRIRLRLAPAGADLPALTAAVAAAEPLRAEPLVSGAGPALAGVALLRLEGSEGAASHGSALATAPNEPVGEREDGRGARFRSWALREGLRYVVHVPVERLPGRFVLPVGAVVVRGADATVFLEDGDGFRPVPVRVEHLDARHAVVANDGALFPGDRVVTANAYALSLALQAHAGAGGAGAHAGHAHD
jgi:multidrug efflux pump subunit AcrA (membrane-fusion protein)